MKIKFLDRFFLFLGAVLTILTGIALAVTGLQFTGVFAETVPLWVRVICIVLGVLLIAFGAYVIAFPHRYSSKRGEFVVQRTDSGELRIAVKAIENLVQKCLDLHEEIYPKSMQIINGREGVVVDLTISLANNISIPLAVASLQKQIKQYLVASSGIEVKEVRVSVESTQDDPEMFEAQEDEAPVTEIITEKEAREKKAPLHQRLFGKPDQPAIVPEPPKEEEDPWRKPLEPTVEPAAEEEPISPAESGEETPAQAEEETPAGEESTQPEEIADDTAEDTSKAESTISEAEEAKPETEE